VGMWGISWGGFNALQVAMRRPPGLKAILALHASDDLFHDDVHYIDGAFHVDPYALEIDHENGLPRTPDYALDSAYFANRFEAEPWIFTYLRQDRDGAFWRDRSLRFHPEQLRIPVYLIGGLLDGYRDAIPRLLGSLRVPLKAEIGPWEHDWPDNGMPGPNYEWRSRAVRWWDLWLKGRDTGLLREPRLLLFVRDGHAPSDTMTFVPGRWRFTNWPMPGARRLTLHPASGKRLLAEPPAPGLDSLQYVPTVGTAAEDWWGDRTADMAADDAGSLTYDGSPLGESVIVAGFPRVELVVAASAPLANWTLRLEDVGPDGRVTLVTGAAANGSQLGSRLAPRRHSPGRAERLAVDLHFTTWTFRPGHRIRLAVANAQFPMLWPTPFPMVTTVSTGADALLRLPVVPADVGYPADLPAPEPRAEPPDAAELDSMPPGGRSVAQDPKTGATSVELRSVSGYRIGEEQVEEIETDTWRVGRDRPAEADFAGTESHRIQLPGRIVQLQTLMEIRSDSAYIRARFVREVSQNGSSVRRRVWTDSIPRLWH